MPGPLTSRRVVAALVVGVVGLAACSASEDRQSGFRPLPDTPVTSRPQSSTTPDSSTPSSSPATSTSTSTSSTTSTSTTTTTIDPLQVRHAYPVDPAVNSSWTPEAHSNYRATDVFASAECGTQLFAPVTGVVDEVRPDQYDRDADDPALRGGNSLSIIGDDGVRYYMAHFQDFDPSMAPGVRVEAGQPVGLMGDTGRAGACHLHFGLSMPCPDGTDDWWVRRGVIWPDEYLASWKEGGNASPLAELQAWFAEYPDACRSLEDTPYPRA